MNILVVKLVISAGSDYVRRNATYPCMRCVIGQYPVNMQGQQLVADARLANTAQWD